MNSWDTLRDLKIGDAVKYDNVYVHDGLKISGQGKVFGFGVTGQTEIVWVISNSGEFRGIEYEKIEKI